MRSIKYHLKFMNMAREVEAQSPHPTHKVGAVLHGVNTSEQEFAIAKSNFWPASLENTIGRDHKLGNASTTIHAEIATILEASATEDSNIYITDLPCPNCAKSLAEARIKSIFIDAQTHNTALGKKMKPYFNEISLLILQAANINIYEIDVEDKTIQILNTTKVSNAVYIEHPAYICALQAGQIHNETFKGLIAKQNKNIPFAACIAKTPLGQYRFIAARTQHSVGLKDDIANNMRQAQKKYMPTQQPLNRLLITCARYGMKIEDNFIYSSQTPTSREFVNLIGSGRTKLTIGETKQCRDEYGLKALQQIQTHKILDIK